MSTDLRLTSIVSQCVFRDGGQPRSARRESPVDDQDSGWCFLGEHPDDKVPGYGDDWTKWCRVTLTELIESFPAIAAIVDEAEGSEWVWDDLKQSYRLSYTL